MVEVERLAAFEGGAQRFVHLSVEAHEATAARRPRSQRQPIEVNGCRTELPQKAASSRCRGEVHLVPGGAVSPAIRLITPGQL